MTIIGTSLPFSAWTRMTDLPPIDTQHFADPIDHHRYNGCRAIVSMYNKVAAQAALHARIADMRAADYLRTRQQADFIQDLNAMYGAVLEEVRADRPVQAMFDPGPDFHPDSFRRSNPAVQTGFRTFGIAFRGDDRHPEELCTQGFMPKTARGSTWAQSHEYAFDGTVLDISGDRYKVFWVRGRDDIAQETAVCVARNAKGGVPFPNTEAEHAYIYAVHVDLAYDSEARQIAHSSQPFFAQGEKAVQSIPGFNIVGWALCKRGPIDPKFQFARSYHAVKLPDGKYWSRNPKVDVTPAEALYLDAVFSEDFRGTYQDKRDHWVSVPAALDKDDFRRRYPV